MVIQLATHCNMHFLALFTLQLEKGWFSGPCMNITLPWDVYVLMTDNELIARLHLQDCILRLLCDDFKAVWYAVIRQ